jgi:DNA gyrase subunit A
VYDIPEGAKNSKGRAIQNMLNLDSDDSINACLHIRRLSDPEFCRTHYVVFCTRDAIIKKTSLEEYSRPRANGVNAVNIKEGDKLVSVCLTRGDEEIIVADRNGRAIHFNESTVRSMGRVATGVRAMKLDEGDEVVGMVSICDKEKETVLVVSEQGFGKRSPVEDYRITNRGGKGVKTMNITDKTGKLVAIKSVTDDDDLMIVNVSGITLRLHATNIRVTGRATQGVRLINLEKRGDTIASICRVPREDDEATESDGAADAENNDSASRPADNAQPQNGEQPTDNNQE